METASPVHLKEANRKFNIVQAYFQRHTDIYQDIKERTLRRWVQQFREAEASLGCGQATATVMHLNYLFCS
jgi:putative transposase